MLFDYFYGPNLYHIYGEQVEPDWKKYSEKLPAAKCIEMEQVQILAVSKAGVKEENFLCQFSKDSSEKCICLKFGEELTGKMHDTIRLKIDIENVGRQQEIAEAFSLLILTEYISYAFFL